MITPQWQEDLTVAMGYFEDHMGTVRYYGAGSLYEGRWFGKGATLLGLGGKIKKPDFSSLCNNQNPKTGHRLTQRQRADRRIFCDFVLSPPKAYSILALVGQDTRLLEIHRHASMQAAAELEKLAMCRSRAHNRDSDMETANVIGAQFSDPTSRAMDPHLHDHLVHFNATWDPVTQTWKALQNSEMLKGQKYVESLYYHVLAQELIKIGYEIRTSPGGMDFDIVGLDNAIIEKFSKRHRQIQTAATEMEHAKGGNVKDHAEMLAHKVREPKQKDITREELLGRWRAELTPAEMNQIDTLVLQTSRIKARALPVSSPAGSVSWALRHLLERRAVVRDHEVLRHALDRARGTGVGLEQIRRAFLERKDILRAGRSITTAEVLATETALLDIAAQGKGKHGPINAGWEGRHELNDEQREALQGILRSGDEHLLIQGGAGAGKSFLLNEVCRAAANVNLQVVVLAPQAQQVHELEKDGLPSPQTVASALKAEGLPDGAIVICDEAGQIGSVSLLHLFRLCRKHSCRLILAGDTRQHGPVERGDALRSLEKYAGVETFYLDQNQRQNPAKARNYEEAKRIEIYREAVQCVARGDIAKSLQLLEVIEAIREVVGDKLECMAEEYLRLARLGESILAISQTRSEVSQLNLAIRQALQMESLIGADTWEVEALVARDHTEAEKEDPRTYTDNPKLVLHSNVMGWKAGQVLEVTGTKQEGIIVRTQRSEYVIPWSESTKWQVCLPQKLKIAPGEKLQLRRNQRAVQGRDSFINGEIVEVSRVLANGTINLKDGRSLPPEYRTFQLGYATTSYGGQGKTVEHVLVADSGSKAATNARQWYVDISRGRKSVRIFTSDKAGLKSRICEGGQNPLALEVFQEFARTPAPRAGQRDRAILKALAAQCVRRTRKFIQECCRHFQAMQTIISAEQVSVGRMAAATAQLRMR